MKSCPIWPSGLVAIRRPGHGEAGVLDRTGGRGGVVAVEWRNYAEQMALLARDLLAQDSVQATLDEIAASAVKLVDGCSAAGILAVRQGRAVTLAACGDMVHESDRLQGELGEGPCFDLARRKDGERIYRIADVTQPRPAWQRFAAEAGKLGIGSTTGVLLYTNDEDFGALNLYAGRPGAFSKDNETAGWLLVSHAAVALADARTIDQQECACPATRLRPPDDGSRPCARTPWSRSHGPGGSLRGSRVTVGRVAVGTREPAGAGRRQYERASAGAECPPSTAAACL